MHCTFADLGSNKVSSSSSLKTIRTLRSLNATKRTYRGTSAGLILIRSIPVVTCYGRRQIPRIIPTSTTATHTTNDSSIVHRPAFTTNITRVPLISSSLIRNRNDMRACYFNAQSVCNKTLPISDINCECDVDVIAITETWLKSTIDASTVRALIPSGYSQRWSNIRLATRPESVTRDRRATYEG